MHPQKIGMQDTTAVAGDFSMEGWCEVPEKVWGDKSSDSALT